MSGSNRINGIRRGLASFVFLLLGAFMVPDAGAAPNNGHCKVPDPAVLTGADGFYYPVGETRTLRGRPFPKGPRGKDDETWKIDQCYGDLTKNLRRHAGEDWNLGSRFFDVGEPVYAVAPGAVEEIRPEILHPITDKPIGSALVIKHAPADGSDPYYSLYLHIDINEDLREAWLHHLPMPVGQNTEIGTIADMDPESRCKDKAYYCPHLHFELRNQPVDIAVLPGYYKSWTPLQENGIVDPSKVTAYTAAPPPTTSAGSGFSSTLIIDTSGSMAGSKLEQAKNAAAAFDQALSDSAFLSLIGFTNSAKVHFRRSAASQSGQGASGDIRSLTAGGGTDIGKALSLAFSELSSAPGGSAKSAVLLTDGLGPGADVAARFGNKTPPWPIYPVGFGADMDKATLERIALLSGGFLLRADEQTFAHSFQHAVALMRGETVDPNSYEWLAPDDSATYLATIPPDATAMNAYGSWQGSRLDLDFVDPGGRRWSAEDIRAAGGAYRAGSTSLAVEIPDPQPGEWQVVAYWSDPPGTAERVNIMLTNRSPVFLGLTGLEPQYQIGEPVSFRLLAAENTDDSGARRPLAGAQTTVEVMIPRFDDGRPDYAQQEWSRPAIEAARQNVLTVPAMLSRPVPGLPRREAVFDVTFRDTGLPGPYVVTATVRGHLADGTEIERVIHGTFQVGPLDANVVQPHMAHNLRGLLAKRYTPAEAVKDVRRRSPADVIRGLRKKKQN